MNKFACVCPITHNFGYAVFDRIHAIIFSPSLFEWCIGSFTYRKAVNNEELRDGANGLSFLESLIICRFNYKSSTFYSVIKRPWVLVRSGYRNPWPPHGSSMLNQLGRPVGSLRNTVFLSAIVSSFPTLNDLRILSVANMSYFLN